MGLKNIIGKPNSGKTFYALREALETSEPNKTCIITLELTPRKIEERVFNYTKNRGMSLNSVEDINIKQMDIPCELTKLCEYITKMCDHGYENFFIDSMGVIKGDNIQDVLYNLSEEKNCNIIITVSVNSKITHKDLLTDSDQLRENENTIFISKSISNNIITRLSYNFKNSDVESFTIDEFIN
jgi:hypothetical protein